MGVGYLRSGITRGHDYNNCGEWRDVLNDDGVRSGSSSRSRSTTTRGTSTIVSRSNTATVPVAMQTANTTHHDRFSYAGRHDLHDGAGTDIPARNGGSSHPPRCLRGWRSAPGVIPSVTRRPRHRSAPVREVGRAGLDVRPPGGTDTTFTGGDVSDPTHPSRMGHWLPWPGAHAGRLHAAFKATHPDWKYLFPIDTIVQPDLPRRDRRPRQRRA